MHGESFKADIQELSASLPANYFQVVLEITERDMLDQHEATKIFEWLHAAGLEIAIDDFAPAIVPLSIWNVLRSIT